jgi:hypothetical protein
MPTKPPAIVHSHYRPKRARKRVTAIAAICCAVSACAAPGPDWAALRNQANEVRAQCAAAESRNGHLAGERCAAPKVHDIYAKAGVADIDLLDAYQAKREAIAEREDVGQITETEANAEIAQARADGISALQARVNERTRTTAAILSATPTPMTCTTFGVTTTCY